jgi:isochorismate synthase
MVLVIAAGYRHGGSGLERPGLGSAGMLFTIPTIESMRRALADRAGPDSSVTIQVDCDPLELLRAGAASVGTAVYFSSPDGGIFGGLGVAQRHSASGPDRLGALDLNLQNMPAGAPCAVGFAFGDEGPASVEWGSFAPATVVLPEVAIRSVDGTTQLTLTPRPGSDGSHLLELLASLEASPRAGTIVDTLLGVEARPSPTDWRGLVGDARAAIASGAFVKVVLARTVVVRSARAIPVFDVVALLQARYPSCRVFGWQEGATAFVGASPELLVERHGRQLRVEPLAGSARRGADPRDDERIGDELLASVKDRMEHALVVDDVIERLGPLVTDISAPDGPVLHQFATVQHLATPISAMSDARLLELAAALHPTPAVGGVPRPAATDFIAKVEGIDRGWYAGGIGWADDTGDGELALGLRSALIDGDRAILYAGNGIVAASEPEAELEETRLKLRPMLDLLTGV